MDIQDHIQRVRTGLSAKPGVVQVENPIIRILPAPGNRATVRVRLYFYDDSFLEIDEIVETRSCHPEYLKYSYQYMKDEELIFRYDNAPHHRELATFPHHKHVGRDEVEDVEPAFRPSHSALFKEIITLLSHITP